jgi:Zn-finger nucleic acid-binding protein
MPAEILTCRGCGAPVGPGAETCTSCGSPFLLLPCHGCGRALIFGTPECPQCHEPGPRALPSVPTRHPCPACDGMLHRPAQPAVGLEHCLRCGGLWVEADLFIALCTEASSKEGRRLPERQGGAAGVPNQALYRACPECAKPMNRHQFAPGAGVIVDNCREHGIWLDAGEWVKIAAYLRTGGLKKAGQELEPFLKQHFGHMDLKGWGTMARNLATAQGPDTSLRYQPGLIYSGGSYSSTNPGLGWLVVDALFFAIDIATDS